MKKAALPTKTIDVIIPVSIAFLLIIGIFISIVQVQQPQKSSSSAQTALKNCTVAESELSLDAREKEMFDLINHYRQQQGLQPLNYDKNIQRASQWMSNDMNAGKKLEHIDSLGRDVSGRIKDCGLTNANGWGENISQGYQSVEKAFEGWKNSPGHNKNMLGAFTHVGVAEKNTYWTLALANITNGSTAPPPVVPGVTVSLQPTSPVVTVKPTPTTAPKNPSPTIGTPQPTTPAVNDLSIDEIFVDTEKVDDICSPLGVVVRVANKGPKITQDITVKTNVGTGVITEDILANDIYGVFIPGYVTSGETVATIDPDNKFPETNENNNQAREILPVPTRAPRCPTLAPTRVPTSEPGAPTPVPTDYPGFAPNPNDLQVLVSVKLPGIGVNGNKNPKNQSRKVNIKIYDLDNDELVSGQGFLTFDKADLFRGIIHLGKVPDGVYYVKVVGDHTLTELVMPQFQPLLKDRLNVLSPVVLINGELTADNQLTIQDFNTALMCFQDKKCGSKPLTDGNGDGTVDVYDSIDINDDGKVDVIDYNFFLHNYRQFSGD